MDRLEQYRQIIMEILEEFSSYTRNDDPIQDHLIFDKERDRYQLLGVGWQNNQRVLHPSIHIEIINEKVWLQHDTTDAIIADELIERGIPQTEIVLGFHPEHKRKHTGFAIT